MPPHEFPEECAHLAHEKHVVTSGWVNKITAKRHRSVLRYLFVTRLDLYLFRQHAFSRKLELSVSFSWWDLLELTSTNERNVTLVFKQNKRLELHNLPPHALTHFYRFITSVMIPEEYPVMKLPSGFKPKPGHGSVIERLRLVMKRSGHTLSQAAESSVQHYLNKKPCEFRLNQLKMIINYLPTFLQSLVWIPSVNTLIVPCKASLGGHNPMKLLADYLPRNSTIGTIVFRDRLSSGFPLFVSLLANVQIRPISVFRFEGCDLSAEEVEALMKWIRVKPVSELALVDSLSPMVTARFLRGLAANPGMAAIRNLILDGSPALNVEMLLSFVQNVEVLSLNKCDIEIAEFLNAVGKIPDCRIQRAFFSGNKCTRMIDRNLTFPPSLFLFMANDIFWHPVCLRHFFTSVMKHTPVNARLSLSLENARLPPDKWDDFFARMSRMKSASLQALKWDGNPVSEYFFDFLENCPALDSLSLCGCFGQDDPLIRTCAEFLSDSRTIVRFLCAGTPRKYMGTSGTNLMIESLRRNRSIKTFYLDGNNAGPKMLVNLARVLMQNRYVEAVSIGDNDIPELASFHTFFEQMLQRGRPLAIPWPKAEIERMLQYGTATEKMVRETKQLYKRVLHGDDTIKIEKEMIENVEGDDVPVPVVQETTIVMPAAEDVL